MVGIFKGSTPVNPSKGSAALKEVYVGSVKVWPTTPPYPWLELIGTQAVAVSGSAATILYRSNDAIIAVDGSGNVVRCSFASSAFPMGGTRSTLNGYAQTAITLRSIGAFAVDAEAFNGTNSQANDQMFVKVGVDPAEGDFIDGVFFRFSTAGALNFTTDPGLTVNRTATGTYTVNLPPGKRLAANGSVIITAQGTGLVIPTVSLVNAQRTSFELTCINVSFSVVDTSLAVYIAMIDI